MWRQLNTDEVAEPNAFAIQATIAAFQYGEEWLDELREYVEKNKQYVTEFLQEKIPLIHPVAGDATYLMWLDCRKITESGRQFVKFIRKPAVCMSAEAISMAGEAKDFARECGYLQAGC